MPSVFVSSLVRGFEEYRAAARQAIGRLRWVAIMSEDQPAGDLPPRAALLREVARADAFLLLLGESYGASAVPSPTEEEFQEAERLGKPVFVMVQEGVAREPAQQAFIDRVSSGWPAGRYRGSFSTPEELKTEVVLALRALEAKLAGANGGETAARERVEALIDASERGWGQSPQARLVVLPSGGGHLISAADLNRGATAERLADLVRGAGLAGALAGFEPSVSASGVEIVERNHRFQGEQLRVRVETDGALIVEGPISGEGQ
ncbi:MAG: DUF4062 domain-containing protein, partial [Thermoleophilia bacterium]|nr:DUF4062 domain-containing protein [Thermoleophilia bacterium]